MAKRYSDSELEEFKTLVLGKIEKTKNEIASLEDQKNDHSESLNDNGYDVDENHGYADVEFLSNMIQRQKKHLNDLENALIRIRNKSYGICVVTGEVINKKRLMAVPTTTKSLQAKMQPQSVPATTSEEPKKERPAKRKQENKIISRVIKKSGTPAPKIEMEEDEDLDFDDLNLDLGEEDVEEMAQNDDIDFDEIVDESTLDD